MGDGCAYAARHLNPSHIIDMATLTGAQGIATGQRHGAVYTNDDDFEQLAIRMGKFSGDLVHPIPYAPEFFVPEFASSVADMKNSVACRSNAQSSCAGQFIGKVILCSAILLRVYLALVGTWETLSLLLCLLGTDFVIFWILLYRQPYRRIFGRRWQVDAHRHGLSFAHRASCYW